jgi:hypothetical protein
MLLWHDDVRPAPEGWVWVKTNEEALEKLRNEKVQIISLDHDLGADPEDGILARGHSPNGNGFDLLKQMIEEKINPLGIIIHSMSPAGNNMSKFCDDLGLKNIREVYSSELHEALGERTTIEKVFDWFK